MSRVSIEDLNTARAWLDVNEGQDGEAEACHRVADWLLAEIAKRETSASINNAAKRLGVSPQRVRAAIRGKKAKP